MHIAIPSAVAAARLRRERVFHVAVAGHDRAHRRGRRRPRHARPVLGAADALPHGQRRGGRHRLINTIRRRSAASSARRWSVHPRRTRAASRAASCSSRCCCCSPRARRWCCAAPARSPTDRRRYNAAVGLKRSSEFGHDSRRNRHVTHAFDRLRVRHANRRRSRLGADLRGLRPGACVAREEQAGRAVLGLQRPRYFVFFRPLFELHAGLLGYVCRSGRRRRAETAAGHQGTPGPRQAHRDRARRG